MVILTAIIIVIKFQFINNKTIIPTEYYKENFFFSDSLTLLTNNMLEPNSYIGVISETDCSTCYEILLTRLNTLKLNKSINDGVYVMLIKNYNDKFINFLRKRYRLQIPIVSHLVLPNSLLIKLKTPYLIKTDQNGNINSILQIDIDNINFVLRYFDGLKAAK